jgi:hypothetical protein
MLVREVFYHLCNFASPFCVEYFQDSVSRTICLGLALNHDPPDLYLLSS